jgi:quinol monooxygenase YgiN
MIYLNVLLTVKNEAEISEIRDLLAEQRRRSLAEPGCVRFEVYQSQTNPRVFVLNEHWESQAALDVHRQAAAFKQIYEPRVMPRVDRVPHVCGLVE